MRSVGWEHNRTRLTRGSPGPFFPRSRPLIPEAGFVEAPSQAVDVRRPSLVADLVTLTKPRIISLLLVTTIAPMFMTGRGLPSLSARARGDPRAAT